MILFSVVTVGLEPTVRMLNRRDCQPGRSLVSHEKATDEISATGGRRRLSLIDVNDVLSLCSMAIATETEHLVVFRSFAGFLICA